MKRVNSFVLGFLILSLTTGCVGRVIYTSGPYRGRVIDADTKAPLEGAVVLAIWRKQAPVGAHMPESFVDSLEILTNSNGEFEVPRRTHIVLFGWLLEPDFVAYHPGYAFYPSLHARPQGKDITAAYEQKFFSIELFRFSAREERLKIIRDYPVSISEVPEDRIPTLVRLVNQERQELGLEPTRLGRW